METPDFEDAIRAEPENRDLRLIAADWYEERGDPRAEFIRVQLALQNLPVRHDWRSDMESREALLLAENQKRWNAPVHRSLNLSRLKGRTRSRGGEVRGWSYRRGYIEELSVDCQTFLKHRERLLKIGPITTLRLWNISFADLMTIASRNDFTQFSGINLQHAKLGETCIQSFLSTVDVSQFQYLNLTDNNLTDGCANTMLDLNLTKMKRLVLSQNSISRATLLTLHERFGDCIQHENGDPVFMWKQEAGPAQDEEEPRTISYNDEVLYENGSVEKEYETNSIDRFNGVDELDDEPSQSPNQGVEFEEDERPFGFGDDLEEPDWGDEEDDSW